MNGLPVSNANPGGVGPFQPLPVGTTNGTPMPGTRPENAQALQVRAKDGDTYEYILVPLAKPVPTAPPDAGTTSGLMAGPMVEDIFFLSTLTIYFVGGSGTPSCRWM